MTKMSKEQALADQGYFAGPPVGTSMLPLLREQEDVVVIRPCETVRFLDVILYRRADGETVLHRVVGFRDGAYVLRGDNQTVKEYGVSDDQIIGKLCSFYRKGREYDLQAFPLRVYGFVWWATCPLRMCKRALFGKLGTVRRKLRKKSLG